MSATGSSLKMHPETLRTPSGRSWGVARIYFLVSAVWIAFSDRLLEYFFPERVTSYQTLKGLLFILLTSVLIYYLTRRAFIQQKEQMAEFQRLIENSCDIIWTVEPDGSMQGYSPALERVTGYRLDELTGTDPFENIHPEDRDKVRAAMEASIREPGELVTVEFQLRKKDGTWLDLEAVHKAMDGPGGGLRVIVNTRDVTARKKAEREREAYIERLKAVNQLIRQVAAKRNLDDILKSVAESAASLLGIEIVGVWLLRDGLLEIRGEFGSFYSPTKEARLRIGEGGVGSVVAEGRAVYIPEVLEDSRYVSKEPARRAGIRSFLGLPLRDSGRILGVLACLTKTPRSFSPDEVNLVEVLSNAAAVAIENAENLEELSASYRELQRRQEMLIRSEKLSMIGTMTAGITHEILNPANIISLHAQRLKWESTEGSSGAKSADVILRNVQRIADICQRFRKFSRDEEIQMVPLNPNDVILETLPLVQHEIQVTGVEIDMHLAEDSFLVLGDKNQLQQVFVNLFNNARDAMPSGGRISIVSQEVKADGKRWWEARVTDTGPGIPKEIQRRLFDPFFTTKPKEKGTGLGLFVSLGIIQNHHGAMRVENEPAKGASFIVRLPLSDEKLAVQ